LVEDLLQVLVQPLARREKVVELDLPQDAAQVVCASCEVA